MPPITLPAPGAAPARPPAAALLGEAPLTAEHFERIATMLHEHAGIRLREGKEGLVRARLAKRLRALGLGDFDRYLAHVESERSRAEFTEMVDALTTNKTSFFREHSHFDVLREQVLPASQGALRLWSAGCSSGEEAYTMAMVLHESLDSASASRARILATDISHRVLAVAKAGRYSAETLADVPKALLQKYWRPLDGGARYEAGPALRQLVQFGRLNLMAQWPMRGPFDAIFCRNVMIYFDKSTQQQLVERYRQLLRPGGYLFVGHSESLTGLSHQYRYIQPAVYAR
jgi:chemotaxis protein methyltransferase CheR